MRLKDAVGRFGEDVAAAHLTDAGLTLLDRNWRCPDGELDLVGREGSTLVFVEVKTRSSAAFGDPSEAVTHQKATRIHRLAARWLVEHDERGVDELRFDIVAVLRLRGSVSVTHLRGAF